MGCHGNLNPAKCPDLSQAASPKPNPPLEAHLGFRLRFVSNHVSMRFQQQLEEKGLVARQLADANDAPFFGHLPATERQALTEAALATIRSTFDASKLGTIHFGQVIGQLVGAGVECMWRAFLTETRHAIAHKAHLG